MATSLFVETSNSQCPPPYLSPRIIKVFSSIFLVFEVIFSMHLSFMIYRSIHSLKTRNFLTYVGHLRNPFDYYIKF